MPDGRADREDVAAAIEAIERQRHTLGDAVTDLALAPLRDQLSAADLPASGSDQKLRQTSILFVDIVGSTAIANRLDPEDVDELMDGILQRLTAAVQLHRGRVVNYTGDGFLAAFGADEAREDDPELAVRAGLAILDETRAMAADVLARFQVDGLDVRVGIDTGPVLLGGSVEGERNIRGNAVNVAARMEQSAPIGGLRISHETYRLVRGVFEVTEEPPISVKGIPTPVRTYLVHGAKPRAFRVPTRGIEGLETEMVGRATELACLQRSFAALYTAPSLRVVTVVAEPGLGKSRLLYEFENWSDVQPNRFVIFKGRAQQQTRQQPYGLMRDLFAWRLQIADNDTAEVARQRFVDGVGALFSESDEAPIHLLGHVLGLDFGDSVHVQGIASDPRQIRVRAQTAAAHVLQRMAAADPIVLLIEDLHWADDETLDFLIYLARTHPDLPMMIVGTTRPLLFERRPSWIDDTAPNERIDLFPLDQTQATVLADALLRKLDDPRSAIRRTLTERGDGNPFFMEEIVKMLLDEGVLVPTDRDVWDAVPERLDSQHVPSTLVGVLQARHDALPVEERVALQQASVIGFVFWDRAVAALDNGSPRSLVPLARRGFVKPQPDSSIADAEEFTFEHHLLQQFTYDSVLKRQRCEYHALAAAWLATLAAERGPEFHGATGEHYELAGESAMAVDHYTRAAENAAARDARATALEYVTRALALTPPDDHAIRWRLVLTRESIVAIAGDPAEHDSALDALAMLADALDDDAKRAEAGLRRTLALMDRGEHYAGIIEGQRVIDLATCAGAPRLAALAYAELARAARRTNRAREAADLAARGLDLAREVGDPAVEAALLHALATACSDNGDVMSDRRFTGQALDLARRTGNRLLEARLLNNIGTIEITLGEFDDAGETWETALALSRELEWTYGESIVLLNLAGLATATGANEEAITRGTAAVERAKASASRDLEAAAFLHLGVAHSRLGHGVEARATLTRSRDLFVQNGGEHYAVDPIAALAFLDLAEGDAERAMEGVEHVLAFTAAGGELTAIEEPFRVRLECFTVLDQLGDPRARAILEESQATLLASSEQLPAGAARERFLRANPYQRALLEAYDALR